MEKEKELQIFGTSLQNIARFIFNNEKLLYPDMKHVYQSESLIWDDFYNLFDLFHLACETDKKVDFNFEFEEIDVYFDYWHEVIEGIRDFNVQDCLHYLEESLDQIALEAIDDANWQEMMESQNPITT